MIQDLPPELIDYCIDFLHDSQKSLRSCSLTCNAFLSASQYHLLDFLRLEYSAQFTGFLKLLRNHPGLSSYVRRVSLGDFISSPTTLRPGAAVWTDLASSPLVVVPETLLQLENMTSLELESMRLEVPNSFELFKQCVEPIRSRLKTVIFRHTSFTSQVKFAELVMFFSNIEKLTLNGVHFTSPTFNTPVEAPQSLCHLELRWSSQIVELSGWFQLVAGRIYSMVVTIRDYKEAISIMRIMDIMGPSVVDLELRCRALPLGMFS